jgi:hypothetical protein
MLQLLIERHEVVDAALVADDAAEVIAVLGDLVGHGPT